MSEAPRSGIRIVFSSVSCSVSRLMHRALVIGRRGRSPTETSCDYC
jgi:hypothetical protein